MNQSLIKVRPGDSGSIYAPFPATAGVIALPPESLMWSVGAGNVEQFLMASDIWNQVTAPHLSPGCTVLDLGCGCGRAARHLLPNAAVSRYVGFDLIPENIRWCEQHIRPQWPGKAVFHLYDVYSAEYNPAGTVASTDLTFPCADQSVHLTIAASLFTHLLEPDARHYLRETARVLKPQGRALLSIHTNPAENTKFSGDESRIDIAPDYFEDMARDAGLFPFRPSYFREYEGNSISQIIFAVQKG